MKPVRVPDLQAMKTRGEKIAVLTAYDATTARILDRAGVDVILVGDSAGMVVHGYDTTLPVTLDMMVFHTASVRRGTQRALIVGDMPFLTYHASIEDAVRNAGRMIQEGGAAAVKIEGGRSMAPVVKRLSEIGIPVVGHIGLTPQSIHALGGFRPQGRDADSAAELMADAKAIEEAGAVAIVLESIPAELGRQVTASLAIPTIGIGGGPHCDGQVLVSHDVFGLLDGPGPPFARQYAKLGEAMTSAASAYVADVRSGAFPPARK